jgi:hypothetical protein
MPEFDKHDSTLDVHDTTVPKTEQLVEIRCPYYVTSKKNGREYPCNRLCVKVNPGSSGEAHCSSCKRGFQFIVDGRSMHTGADR